MEKRAISTHSSNDGMPTFKSGYAKASLASTICKVDVPTEMALDCQNDRKMTSLMAKTLRKGLCSASGSLSWM